MSEYLTLLKIMSLRERLNYLKKLIADGDDEVEDYYEAVSIRKQLKQLDGELDDR